MIYKSNKCYILNNLFLLLKASHVAQISLPYDLFTIVISLYSYNHQLRNEYLPYAQLKSVVDMMAQKAAMAKGGGKPCLEWRQAHSNRDNWAAKRVSAH